MPVSALPDTRVDVCIFFLPSSSLRSHDMAALSEIGALVPIVPVVGKVSCKLACLMTCHSYTMGLVNSIGVTHLTMCLELSDMHCLGHMPWSRVLNSSGRTACCSPERVLYMRY